MSKELEKIRKWVWEDIIVGDNNTKEEVNRAIDLTYNKTRQELIKEIDENFNTGYDDICIKRKDWEKFKEKK